MKRSLSAIPDVVLRSFTQNEADAYRAYLEIKYEVFVIEKGWHALAGDPGTGLARVDPFDAQGRFRLACTEESAPIGIVRGIPLKEGFPRRELLGHHLHAPELASMEGSLCTINALAARAPYRGNRYRVVDHQEWTGTLGRLLMLAIIRDLEGEGMQAALATAGGPISVRLCESLGFMVIDPPQKTTLHPDSVMTNVGLVFGSAEHLRSERECGMERETKELGAQATNLLKYFRQRSTSSARLAGQSSP